MPSFEVASNCSALNGEASKRSFQRPQVFRVRPSSSDQMSEGGVRKSSKLKEMDEPS